MMKYYIRNSSFAFGSRCPKSRILNFRTKSNNFDTGVFSAHFSSDHVYGCSWSGFYVFYSAAFGDLVIV